MTQAKRIIIHWTAGGGRANATDKAAYHRLVEHDGRIIRGTETIADNVVTSDGDYAAHTRNLNTQSIGVSMCGMRGAKEYPFDPGPSPLTEVQFLAMCRLVGELCRQYSIPLTNKTVLTHAEVEPTLGVKQRNKWDIIRLPFKPGLVGAIPVGDYIRETIAQVSDLHVNQPTMPTLRMNNSAPRAAVKILQQDLAFLGYHSGAIDGIGGAMTKRSVVSFQSDQGLVADGVVGQLTWAALEAAKPLPARTATIEDLRQRGSETIVAADRGEKLVKRASLAGVAGMGLDTAMKAADQLTGVEGALASLQTIVAENWIILALIGGAAFFYWQGPKIMDAIRQRRLADHQTGANRGR